ncbi:hypothetical protein ACH5RR_009713 [Cinchona calisaya]|uniref:HSF-type DNA-binding domain-containing protein n=1 Tax=Cinchona calisaya TaxID=153742 RepID=A0ABD3AF23_9GENT
METNQKTSEVTNTTTYESNVEEQRANQTVVVEADVGESSSNNNANVVVTASAVSAHPVSKEVYAIGTPLSFSRRRQPPPFLQKVYEIVSKPETNSIISWNSPGTGFVVWDPHKFAAEGFKKISWDRMEFQNEWFRKGKKSWLKRIKRRNQSTQNVQQSRVLETIQELTLPEKQKKLENFLHEHEVLKEEMVKLKEKQEDLEKGMTTLQQKAHCFTFKRQKILKYVVEEVLMRNKRSDAAKEKRTDGQQSVENSVELLDEGETSHRSWEKSPNVQSDTKKPCSDAGLGTAIQEKEQSTIVGAAFPDFSNADYASLEKQLMDDLNCENEPEERTKLQSNVVIALEDLIAGPADWTEFAKELANKARNKC